MIKHLQMAYTVAEAMKLMGLCRASFYQEVNAGRLVTFVIPKRRRRVSARAIDNWIENSERASQAPVTKVKRSGKKTIYRESNKAARGEMR